MLNKIEIAKGIYYVGAVDWTIRDFHGYITPRGVTYNAYLIVDEKICLIDNVKSPFTTEMIERISQIVDPAKIDYVVTNHVEPDHSGSLPALMKLATQAKVVITSQGKAEVLKYYPGEYDFMVVKEGDSIDLGAKKLHFVPLPMLHWPDSMASYLDGEEILFSNDAFGQHLCTSKRFDDENLLSQILYEASKYYANILMPFGKLVTKALPKVKQLPIKLIAPSHGVIWRTHIDKILSAYEKWGSGCNEKKVIIAYDSMWGATEQMGRRILEGVAAAGPIVKMYRMSVADRSEVVMEILEAKGLLIGSSTLNNGVLPTTGALLTYLKGLRPTNKIGAAFGAYGWAGGAQADIEAMLTAAGIDIVAKDMTSKWIPSPEELQKCYDFGYEFGKMVMDAE